MKIRLVDDNRLFLDGLRNLLEANGYAVAGTAAGGDEALARGESPLSQGLAARIMAEFMRRERLAGKPELAEQPEAPSPASLTARQTEILRQVALGRPYKEIALALGLSEATIKYHMGEITARLHLENRAQVIVYASRTATTPRSDGD